MLMESPLDHVAGRGAGVSRGVGQDHSGRTCSRSGFLDGASDVWLSWSAALSVAPVLFFLVPSSMALHVPGLQSNFPYQES